MGAGQQLPEERADMANQNIADDATPLTLQRYDCLQFSVDKAYRWIELFEYIYTHKAPEYVCLEEWNTSPSHFSLLGRGRSGEWILRSAER